MRARLTGLILILLSALVPHPAAARAPCAGETLEMVFAGTGSAPYVWLRAGGRKGFFLVDYGATASSMSRGAFPGESGPKRVSDFSLPGFSEGSFLLFDYGHHSGPPGGQLGIVGTDFLSLTTVTFDYAAAQIGFASAPCTDTVLEAAGFRPISQETFFSHDLSRVPERPNVPVIWVEVGGVRFWAQIDSGYEDSVYPHTVDVNDALFAALRKARVPLRRVGGVTVTTCSVTENRSVYRVETGISVTDEAGTPIRSVGFLHIIPKKPNSCGGIAGMREAAGQIGASLLKGFGTVVFDPKGERIWVPEAR